MSFQTYVTNVLLRKVVYVSTVVFTPADVRTRAMNVKSGLLVQVICAGIDVFTWVYTNMHARIVPKSSYKNLLFYNI